MVGEGVTMTEFKKISDEWLVVMRDTQKAYVSKIYNNPNHPEYQSETVNWLHIINELIASRKEIQELRDWVRDLHSRMYINCVYCGHRYGPIESTPVSMADVLKAHIEVCPSHPMSVLKSDNDRLTNRIEELENGKKA